MAEYKAIPIAREHLSAVAELERHCFCEPWSEKALEILLGENAFGFVLLQDGQAVSYAGMMTVLDEGQITNVATHPDHRHRGCGAAVLKALLGEAEERGLSLISLEVRKSNRDAISLYERAGFRVAGERRNFYKHPTEDAWVMLLERKTLNDC